MKLPLFKITQISDCIRVSLLTESEEGMKELRKEIRKDKPSLSFIELMKNIPND